MMSLVLKPNTQPPPPKKNPGTPLDYNILSTCFNIRIIIDYRVYTRDTILCYISRVMGFGALCWAALGSCQYHSPGKMGQRREEMDADCSGQFSGTS